MLGDKPSSRSWTTPVCAMVGYTSTMCVIFSLALILVVKFLGGGGMSSGLCLALVLETASLAGGQVNTHTHTLTMLPTHSIGTSGSRFAAPLPFVCWRLLVVLPPPVVHRRIHLRLLPCLNLSSRLCLASCPSRLVGCCISQPLSLSLLSHLCPAPRPLPFIMPQPFITPLLFSWLLRCPAPQPPSCCNSTWCLVLRLLLIPCS
jgi:hypothetical protein